MVDTVATRVVADTKNRYVVHLTNISDGTGESAVKKVDKSTLLAFDNAEPASLDIEQVRWNIQGMSSVRLLWDHTTDDVAMVLCGSGYEDFRGRADLLPDRSESNGLRDPRSSGDTGDILLTTNGQVSGGTYDITLWLRKTAD